MVKGIYFSSSSIWERYYFNFYRTHYPNILNLLIVQATIQFSLGILAEAALSYVGLGAQPPIPSLGRMLADSQTMISIAPHMAISRFIYRNNCFRTKFDG